MKALLADRDGRVVVVLIVLGMLLSMAAMALNMSQHWHWAGVCNILVLGIVIAVLLKLHRMVRLP